MKRRLRPLEDWADWMFESLDAFGLAHIVPFGEPFSLCRMTPTSWHGWLGTGDMDEIEIAQRMPRCRECLARIPTDDDRLVP